MTRDVYAGDDALNSAQPAQTPTSTFRISLHADASPDVLLRVSSHVNALNRTPVSFVLQRQADGEVKIEIVISDCTAFMQDMLCRKLAQLTCVYDVDSTEQREQQ
ncbi:MAG TPA: hypothetical protein PKE27_05745 [Povalibacter sp.]|uniref:hypothetical protein n=1 Tax=Povalibacter sp. TaxID=1962978 RepID=UPI002CC03D8F|nr:hypothetical protein [Povalibacter sp.]HMN44051.1 hypothetical protein [Povalibacter sp.]